MSTFNDLTGKHFDKLTVIKRGPNYKHKQSHWWCGCDCNKQSVLVRSDGLNSGNSRSCGCLHRAVARQLGLKAGSYKRPPRASVLAMPGRVFGRLTVVRRGPNRRKQVRFWCICSCGQRCVLVGSGGLKSKHTTSCGCKTRTHGDNRAPEYRVFYSMLDRCYNPKNHNYHCYGLRGITVCDRWRFGENGKSGYECFLEDMGRRPTNKHSIDRINNDSNYNKHNCRWATVRQQHRNKRSNHLILDAAIGTMYSDRRRPSTVSPEGLPASLSAQRRSQWYGQRSRSSALTS
jgi:hypothetical protein